MESISNHNPKIICLIGSTKFKDTFEKVAQELSLAGNIVLKPNVFSQYDDIDLTNEQCNLLIEATRKEIKMADEIMVINVNGYIGDLTLQEIGYAYTKGKRISFIEPLEYMLESEPINPDEPPVDFDWFKDPIITDRKGMKLSLNES